MRRIVWSGRRAVTAVAAAVLLSVALAPVATAQEGEDQGGDGDEAEEGDDGDEAEEGGSGGDGEEAAEEAEELDETNLSGYRLRSEATPFAVLLWEPLMPFPVEPGDPHLTLETAYSQATLNTGPSGRALASYLWPGAAIGDGGIEQIIGQPFDYPAVASARVPQGPEQDEMEMAPGAGMHARAEGTDVEASTTTTDVPSDALATGTFSSNSHSTLEDGQAVTRARSAVSDVRLLGGMIEIDGVTTELVARGDGATAETDGDTTVTGLTIAGYGFTVDEDGLQPQGNGTEDLSLPLGLSGKTPDQLRELLGIEVEMLGHEETVEEAESERVAGGLRISLDTTVLREALLDDLLTPLVGALPDELRNPPLPDEVPVNPVDLLFAEPRVDIVLARAVVEANTTEALELDFDDDFGGGAETGGADLGGGAGGGAEATATSPDLGGGGGDAASSASLPSDSGDGGEDLETGEAPEAPEEPEVAESPGEEQAGMQAAAGRQLPPGSGSSLAVGVLALAAVALATRGLHGMTNVVFGTSAGCDGGHPMGVPDLKEELS